MPPPTIDPNRVREALQQGAGGGNTPPPPGGMGTFPDALPPPPPVPLPPGGMGTFPGGMPPPPPQQQQQQRGTADFDFARVQQYLPEERRGDIEGPTRVSFRGGVRTPVGAPPEAPFQHMPSPGYTPPPEREPSGRMGDPPTPVERRFPGAGYEYSDTPLPEREEYGMFQGLADRAGYLFGRARDKVTEAGQGEFRELRMPWEDYKEEETWGGKALGAGTGTVKSLADVSYNIGQIPLLGKPLTGLVHGTMAAFQASGEAIGRGAGQLSSKSAASLEAAQQEINKDFGDMSPEAQAQMGSALLAGVDPSKEGTLADLRRDLKVETPTQEEAFQAALSVTWSGPDAVRAAYEEANELAEMGQLTEENKERLQQRHGKFVNQFLGEAIFDPLNFISMPGKAAQQLNRMEDAHDLLVASRRVGDKLEDTRSIVQEMKDLATVAGQKSAAKSPMEKFLAYINPRLTQSVVNNVVKDGQQVVEFMWGTAQKVVESKAIGKAPEELARLQGEAVQDIAFNFAKMASDKAKEVEEGAKALRSMGFGTLHESTTGRRTGVIMRKMMEGPDGKVGELNRILTDVQAKGGDGFDLAEAWADRAAGIMEDMITVPKSSKHATVTVPQAVIKAVQPLTNVYAGLYMGLSAGFPIRNMFGNSVIMAINGFSPFTTFDPKLAKGLGFKLVRAEAGVGAAGTVEGGISGLVSKLPGIKMSEAFERMASRRLTQQAQLDTLARLQPVMVEEAKKAIPASAPPELIDRLERAISVSLMEGPRGWKKLDDIVQSFVKDVGEEVAQKGVPPTALPSSLADDWRLPSTQTTAGLQKDPDMWNEVSKALSKAASPEEAIEQVRQIRSQFAKKILKDADEYTDVVAGPAAGTMTGDAVQQAVRSQMSQQSIETLAENLSKTENQLSISRARAWASADGMPNEFERYEELTRVEDMYNATIANLRGIQGRKYAEYISGALTEKQYVKAVTDKFGEAYRKLDSAYKKIIGEGRPWQPVEQSFEEARRGLLKRYLAKSAHDAGISSLAIKDLSPVDVPHLYGPDLHMVPDAEFQNTIRKVVRTMGGNDRGLKDINDLTDEQLLAALNHFRGKRGLPPTSPRALYDEFVQRRGSRAALAEAPPLDVPEAVPPGRTLEELEGVSKSWIRDPETGAVIPILDDAAPFTGEVSPQVYRQWVDETYEGLARGAKNAEHRQALEAAYQTEVGRIPLGPGPGAMDSTITHAKRMTGLLDGLVDEITAFAKNPPLPPKPKMGTVPIDQMAGRNIEEWADFLENVKGMYSQAHIMATDVGNKARDAMLFDYADRRYWDPLLKMVYPWGYWQTRFMPAFAKSAFYNPAAVSNYMKWKRELRDYNSNDERVPEWAKDQVVIRPPGFDGQFLWETDAAFNAIGTMFDTWDDPEQQKDAFGRMIQVTQIGGASPHPLLMAAYAAERSLLAKDKDAARSYGYLAPVTRGFASITGKTLEPWLWLTDPRTGERIPWTGGTKYDLAKATRKLGYEAGEGEYETEAAILGATTRAGPEFIQEVENIMKYRAIPVFGSLMFGLRISRRQNWEDEVGSYGQQFGDLMEAGQEDDAFAILQDNPWLGAAWMAYENDAERMASLAKNVFSRIPPGSDAKQDILDAAGISRDMVDAFYEGNDAKGNGLASWDRADYDRFANGILNMAEIVAMPKGVDAKEWAKARNERGKLYEKMEQQFPAAQSQQETYFRLKKVNPDMANEYLDSEGVILRDYWGELNKNMMGSPLLTKYYLQPQKVDMAANTLRWEEAERRWPGIHRTLEQYYNIPEGNSLERREFRAEHPEYREYMAWKDDALANMKDQLKDVRDLAGTGPLIPETLDHRIGGGQPNLAQRSVLETLDEFALREGLPEPPPEERKPSEYTDREIARFAAEDEINQIMLQRYPNFFDMQKEFQEIREQEGNDSAWLWAKSTGYADILSEQKVERARRPEVLIEMEDKELESAAKAVMWHHLEQQFPEYFQLSAGYKNIPRENWQARRAYRDENPQLTQAWDWLDGAEDYYINTLKESRQNLRKQYRAENTEIEEPSPSKAPPMTAQADTPITRIADAIALAEGDDYTAQNPKSTASGRYQYINDTWGGYQGYKRAADAPPNVQDERMYADLQGRLDKYGGDIEKVIAAHYYPPWANDKSKWNQRPTEDQPTIQEYVNRVMENLQ